jgi:hypothetical protein
MNQYYFKYLSKNKKTASNRPTITESQGGFKKSAGFFPAFVSYRFITGISVDSLDRIVTSREAGRLSLENFPSGFI